MILKNDHNGTHKQVIKQEPVDHAWEDRLQLFLSDSGVSADLFLTAHLKREVILLDSISRRASDCSRYYIYSLGTPLSTILEDLEINKGRPSSWQSKLLTKVKNSENLNSAFVWPIKEVETIIELVKRLNRTTTLERGTIFEKFRRDLKRCDVYLTDVCYNNIIRWEDNSCMLDTVLSVLSQVNEESLALVLPSEIPDFPSLQKGFTPQFHKYKQSLLNTGRTVMLNSDTNDTSRGSLRRTSRRKPRSTTTLMSLDQLTTVLEQSGFVLWEKGGQNRFLCRRRGLKRLKHT